jgi:2-dehydropantoate 2-reductase
VGGYFGAKLALAGHDVMFTARRENLAALRRRGLTIERAERDLHIAAPRAAESPRGEGPFELVLVCVKARHTDTALAGLDGELESGAIVISLQNGVESEDKIEQLLGVPSLLRATAYVGVELVRPGVVRHTSGGTIVVGEVDGRRSERLERLERLLSEAAIEVVVPPDILRAKWQKLAWNASFNLVCALSGATIGAILDDPEARGLVEQTMAEVEAVASAEGVTFEVDYVPRVLRLADRLHRAVRPSTLQDREKRRPLEHEALTGAVVRLGERHGVATPINRTLDRLARLVSASSP